MLQSWIFIVRPQSNTFVATKCHDINLTQILLLVVLQRGSHPQGLSRDLSETERTGPRRIFGRESEKGMEKVTNYELYRL
jgi:hypothetical protein